MTKRLLVTLLLLAWCTAGETTVLGGEYFLYPGVNFGYWSNHCRRSDMDMLYYTGLMEALDAYVARRQEEGALARKKLEIWYKDPVGDAGMPLIEVSQNRRGFYITSRHAPDLNLRQLVRLVEYFGSANWRSFCCYPRTLDRSLESVRDRFARLLDREVGQPDMSFFAGRRSVVFEVGDLQIVYENDGVFYSLAGKRLDLEPADPTPVQVEDRYVFGSKDFLHVYESGAEIRRVPKSYTPYPFPCRARAHGKWVNFGCEGVTSLTYSYAQNCFFKIGGRHDEDDKGSSDPNCISKFEGWRDTDYKRAKCSDEPGLGEVHPRPLRVSWERVVN